MDESLQTHLETRGGETEQPVRVMKLSEAIRLGSMIRPQCTGRYAHGGRSCALMAAGEATGMAYPVPGTDDHVNGMNLMAHLNQHFPWIDFHVRNHCICMSDFQGATREQIADWLESQNL